MKVSVIIPVYNAELYLDRCIASVIGQSHRNWEMILVDDGSTDRSPHIARRWVECDCRIRYVRKENGGPSSARNLGLTMATGDYIHFLDSDDWIDPQTYARCAELIARYEAPDLVAFSAVATDFQRRVTAQSETVQVLNKSEMFGYFFRIYGEPSNYSIWDKLIRRSVLKGFSFPETMFEDVEASYEFYSRAASMVKTSAVFYYYFKNTSSITNSAVKAKDLDLLKVWNRLVQRTKTEHPEFYSAAIFNRKRADFTVLAKMLLKGYDKASPELCAMRPVLKKAVRENFWALLFGKMPISRKVLLILVAL